MITTNKSSLVKEGYLDVKFPPANRERKLWKAWQRRWLLSKSVEEPRGLEIQIYGCQKISNGQLPLWTIFISPDSAKLYRSRSRTHAWAFSIAHEAVVLLHLAGETEQLSQTWMASLRDVLWPPSPLVQLEEAFQDVHRVSLIDDEYTCRSELFGAYGHLYVAGEVLLLMSTHSGKLIKQWSLRELVNVQLQRLHEVKTSGVFSITVHRESSEHGEKLDFYSNTAAKVVESISAALKMKQEGKVVSSSQSTRKYDSGIQDLAGLLSIENKKMDERKSWEFDEWPSRGHSEGFRNFATMSGDFLNCSINSVFLHHACSVGSRSSSEASSDYSPPATPTEPSSSNWDSSIICNKTFRNSGDFLENYYEEANFKLRRNSLEDFDVHDALIASHRSSAASDIYADISSLPPSKRPSIAETLYEDIEEGEENFTKLMDGIMEDEYMPPLPPPRVPYNTNTCDLNCARHLNTAKRPSTLGLENLSSSISETLSQVQTERLTEPNYKLSKQTFSVRLFKPIKGVKKILSNKKNLKHQTVSPSQENPQKNFIPKENCNPQGNEVVNIGRFASEPLLIMEATDHPSKPVLNGSCNGDGSYPHTQVIPISGENFVPFPELLSTVAVSSKIEPHPDQNELRKNIPSSESSSVVIRNGGGRRQSRSCESILESLKSKYNQHQEFLNFLQTGKDENDSHDTCRQNCCLTRSVSLGRFPCKSLYSHEHCNRSVLAFSGNLDTNLSNKDSLSGPCSAEPRQKINNLNFTVLRDLSSRRRSSDYCVMNLIVPSNSSKESAMSVNMRSCDAEADSLKVHLGQEWSSSLQMQMTEQESLYMDMTLITK